MNKEAEKRLREAIVRNYRNCPDQMKAVWLRYCEKIEMAELKEIFGLSERSTYRLLQEGLSILRGQLSNP
jgi:DNA-directed RNA polymerase specialized sigma24 family protein